MRIIKIDDLEVLKDNNKTFFDKELNREVNENAYLSIVVTNACQLQCSYCINSHTDCSLELPLEKAINNIKRLKIRFGVKECVILGGEPLIYPKISELISELQDLDFEKICLTTNGLEMNESLITQLVDNGLTHLNISLHNSELSEKYRRIIQEIKLLNPSLSIRINTNVYLKNNDNFSDLIKWLEYLQNFQVDSIRVSNIIFKDSFSVNDKNNKETEELILSNKHYNLLFDSVICYFSERVTCINNPKTLGFVDYTLIPTKVPIIINRNIDSDVSKQVCENEGKVINTFKCLVNGDISLSWNENNVVKNI